VSSLGSGYDAVTDGVLELCSEYTPSDFVALAMALLDIQKVPHELLMAVLLEPASCLPARLVAMASVGHLHELEQGRYADLLQPALDSVGGDREMIRLMVAALDQAGLSAPGQIAVAQLALRCGS
jgi:hypothetical protein